MAKTSLDDILNNLDNQSVEALTQIIEEAKAARERQMAAARDALLRDVKARAQAMGLSMESLARELLPDGGRASPQGAKGELMRRPVAAKYRGPNGEEWSGRGRTPRWLQAVEAGGGKREDFLITAKR